MNFPLIGNESVRASVLSLIGANRIPHAILIEGEDGLGKRTLAGFIASSIVCTAENRPCGTCHGCHLASIASHPDIIRISREEGKKSIRVGQIRQLRADAFVRPHSAERKVFIIEDAYRMNEQAQNALLKVLEEPPQSVVFILLTTARSTMLDTIVSRCTLLQLSAPRIEESVDAVMLKCGCEHESAVTALKHSSGNIGRALTLLGKKANDTARESAVEFLRLLFSGSDYEMLKLLHPFEKNRLWVEDFLKALRVEIVRELRGCNPAAARARVLDGLYSDIARYLELLKTNINLSLLFTALVSASCKRRAER